MITYTDFAEEIKAKSLKELQDLEWEMRKRPGTHEDQFDDPNTPELEAGYREKIYLIDQEIKSRTTG